MKSFLFYLFKLPFGFQEFTPKSFLQRIEGSLVFVNGRLRYFRFNSENSKSLSSSEEKRDNFSLGKKRFRFFFNSINLLFWSFLILVYFLQLSSMKTAASIALEKGLNQGFSRFFQWLHSIQKSWKSIDDKFFIDDK